MDTLEQKAFGEALKVNKTLTVLGLRLTHTHTTQMKITSLYFVHLVSSSTENRNGNEGAKALASITSTSKFLESLNISGNKLYT